MISRDTCCADTRVGVCPIQSDHLSQQEPRRLTQCKSSLFKVFKLRKLHGIIEASKGFQKQHNLCMHRISLECCTNDCSEGQHTRTLPSTSPLHVLPDQHGLSDTRTELDSSNRNEAIVQSSAPPPPLRLLTCHKSLRLDSPPPARHGSCPPLTCPASHLVSRCVLLPSRLCLRESLFQHCLLV